MKIDLIGAGSPARLRGRLLLSTLLASWATTAEAETIEIATPGAVVAQTTDVTGDPAILISADNVSLTLDGATVTSTMVLSLFNGGRDTSGAILIKGDNASITISSTASIAARGIGVKEFLETTPGGAAPIPGLPAGASVINFGSIVADLDDGIELGNGAYIENHGSITGGADFLSGAASRFRGSTGDGASAFMSPGTPEEVTADPIRVRLVNFASGEIVGARFGVALSSGSELINDGIIRGVEGGILQQGAGMPVFDASLGEVVLLTPHAKAILHNTGTIAGIAGDGATIFSNSDTNSIQNFNLSTLADPGGALALFDRAVLDFDALDMRLENSGLIETSAPAVGSGVVGFFNPDTNMFEELFVTSTIFAINSGSAAGYIFNDATGVIRANADPATGERAGAVSLLAIDPNLALPGAIRLDNKGEITGNILGSDGQELIFNEGTITGSIALGLGDDLVILGPDSMLTGSLTLGDGNDILVADTQATVGGILDGGGDEMTPGDDLLMLMLGGTTLSTNQIFGFERVEIFGSGPLDNIDLSQVSQINVGGGGVLDIGSTGFTGEVEVMPGGKIVGLGFLGLLIVRDGGTVSPGNSIGAITVTGDVSFDAGSIFEVEINPTTSDQVLASGAVMLGGGVVTVSGENGIDLAAGLATPDYVILSGEAGLTGEFDSVTDDLQFYHARLIYTPTEAQLVLDPVGADFLAAGLTPTELSVGAVLQGALLAADGDFLDAMRTSFPGLDGAGVRGGLNQIAGVFHAAAPLGASQLALLSAETARRTDPLARGERRAWVGGFYNGLDLDGVRGGAGQDLDLGAALMGVEVGAGNGIVAGLFGGYARLDGDDAVGSEIDGDGYVIGGSARAAIKPSSLGQFSLGVQAGYLDVEYDVSRAIAIGDLARTARSEGDVDGAFIAADASFAAALSDAITAGPFAEFSASSMTASPLFETGAGSLDLAVEDVDFNRRTLRAGARLAIKSHRLTLEIQGGYQGELGDTGANYAATLAGVSGGAFLASGARLAEDAAFAGAEVSAALTERVSATLGYRGEFGDEHSAQGAQARLNMRF